MTSLISNVAVALPPGGGGNNVPVWLWAIIAGGILVTAAILFLRNRKK
jgi:LPXTG-motif cell wall-anchored protein